MMTLLRKHRNWMMIVIAILAIPFIFYFNKTDPSRNRPFAHIYGREVSVVDGQRERGWRPLRGNSACKTLCARSGQGRIRKTNFTFSSP